MVEFFGEEEFKKLCNHEAGHALIAYLFKRPLEYVKMDMSKERPGITHIAGSELEGDAHIAMAGHLAEFLICQSGSNETSNKSVNMAGSLDFIGFACLI